MVYIEEPDGFEHQYLLTDPRQASNPLDPKSIGPNQDPAKVARYAGHIESAYRTANEAVARIMDAVSDGAGELQEQCHRRVRSRVRSISHLGQRGQSSGRGRNSCDQSSRGHIRGSRQLLHQPHRPRAQRNRGSGGIVTLQKQILQLVKKFKDTNPRYAGKRGSRCLTKFMRGLARKSNRSQLRPRNRRVHRTRLWRRLRHAHHRIQL